MLLPGLCYRLTYSISFFVRGLHQLDYLSPSLSKHSVVCKVMATIVPPLPSNIPDSQHDLAPALFPRPIRGPPPTVDPKACSLRLPVAQNYLSSGCFSLQRHPSDQLGTIHSFPGRY